MNTTGHKRHQLSYFSAIFAFWLLLFHAGSLSADFPQAEINWFLKPMVDDTEIEMRITSVDETGKRMIADVQMRYTGAKKAIRLIITGEKKEPSEKVFCLSCASSDILESCDVTTAKASVFLDPYLPETLLPWHVLTDRFCRKFKAIKSKRYSDTRYTVFELIAMGKSRSTAVGKQKVYVSNATKQPEKIVQENEQGIAISSLHILEIRPTMWGKVVTRSIYRDVLTKTRVLIEVRSGSVTMPDGRERK